MVPEEVGTEEWRMNCERHLCPDTPCLSNETHVSIESEATWGQEQVRHYSYPGAHADSDARPDLSEDDVTD